MVRADIQEWIVKILREKQYVTFSEFLGRLRGKGVEDRPLDRALQGLRRADTIVYVSPPLGWCLTERAPDFVPKPR